MKEIEIKFGDVDKNLFTAPGVEFNQKEKEYTLWNNIN